MKAPDTTPNADTTHNAELTRDADLKHHAEVTHHAELTQISTANRRFNWFVGISGAILFTIGILLLRIDFAVHATGSVYREGEQIVFAPTDGRIMEIFAEEGDQVAAGEAIFRIDSSTLEQERLVLSIELLTNQHQRELQEFALQHIGRSPEAAALSTAPARNAIRRELIEMRADTLRRFEGLDAMRAISGLQIQQEQMNQLREQIELLEGEFLEQLYQEGYFERQRESLELEINQLTGQAQMTETRIQALNEKIADHTVRSPLDGQITRMALRYVGQRAELGEILFRVSDSKEPARIRAYAGQRNIDLVRVGGPVRLASNVFDSPLEGYVEGTVIEVALEPHPEKSAEAGEPMFAVKIQVVSSPFPLVLGTTLDAEILLGKRNLLDAILRRRTSDREASR